MSEHKARERREIRMAEETKAQKEDRAGMVAIVAAILSANPDYPKTFMGAVGDARSLIAKSYEAEGLPSPFPSPAPRATPELENAL